MSRESLGCEAREVRHAACRRRHCGGVGLGWQLVRVGAAHHGEVVECWVFADVVGVFVARWVNVSL
jgi:hypothetical protein